jgi:hypothetical protein
MNSIDELIDLIEVGRPRHVFDLAPLGLRRRAAMQLPALSRSLSRAARRRAS